MYEQTKPGWNYNNSYRYYVAETRNPDGSLDVNGWNPFGIAQHNLTEKRITGYYMTNKDPDEVGTIQTMSDYYASIGICIRPKTW